MHSKQKKIVLVFGGSGLLGIHCEFILKHKYEVILTHNLNPILSSNSVAFNALDNQDELDKIISKYSPDIIINALALVRVDVCESNPDLAERLNHQFVRDLVLSMKKNNLNESHLIQISSDSVYGERTKFLNQPWIETDQLSPMSIYSKTKLKGEFEALNHSGTVSVLRTAFYGINPFTDSGLLKWIIQSTLNNKEIDGWENIYFNPISASEFVKLIDFIIEKSAHGIYNIGSLDSCNKFDYVAAVCEDIGHPVKINRVTNVVRGKKAIRPEYSVLNTQKLSKIISWDLHWRNDLNYYLKNSLPDLLSFYRD
jgi:dTDP-4-dehydrorhamnose reductase